MLLLLLLLGTTPGSDQNTLFPLTLPNTSGYYNYNNTNNNNNNNNNNINRLQDEHDLSSQCLLQVHALPARNRGCCCYCFIFIIIIYFICYYDYC